MQLSKKFQSNKNSLENSSKQLPLTTSADENQLSDKKENEAPKDKSSVMPESVLINKDLEKKKHGITEQNPPPPTGEEEVQNVELKTSPPVKKRRTIEIHHAPEFTGEMFRHKADDTNVRTIKKIFGTEILLF